MPDVPMLCEILLKLQSGVLCKSAPLPKMLDYIREGNKIHVLDLKSLSGTLAGSHSWSVFDVDSLNSVPSLPRATSKADD